MAGLVGFAPEMVLKWCVDVSVDPRVAGLRHGTDVTIPAAAKMDF